MAPVKVNVVSFDFAGCGQSGGDYITLGRPFIKIYIFIFIGWNEARDIGNVIRYIKRKYGI